MTEPSKPVDKPARPLAEIQSEYQECARALGDRIFRSQHIQAEIQGLLHKMSGLNQEKPLETASKVD